MKRITTMTAALALLLLGGTGASADTFVRMVSGPAGGSWYPLGAKIAEVWQQTIPGISTSNGPGGGVGNVKDVNKGDAEVGWTYGHTAYNGYAGKGAFQKAQKNVRHFATLYLSAFQTAVPKSSSIRSYADMKDKSVSPGKATFSGYAAASLILSYYGLTFDQIKKNGGTVHHIGYSDSVSLMKDGHLDAFMALTSVPQASFLDLEFNPGIRFIGVEPKILDKILADHPGYLKTELPHSAYKTITNPVPTLGAVAILVINKNVPDDIVYKMTKELWEHHDDFLKVKKVWAKVKLENALLGAAVPVHPGAQRYYDEKHVMKK